jgi:predicted transposase YdaD
MPIIYDLETDIRYLQGKQKGAEEATASALIRGMREGEQETKIKDIKGLLRLGVLTPDQIATALDVSIEFVLTVQAQAKSEGK